MGGILGGVFGVALLLVALWWYLKKKQAEDDDLYFASGGIDSGPFGDGGAGGRRLDRSSIYQDDGPWAGSKASHDTGRSSVSVPEPPRGGVLVPSVHCG